MVRLWVLAEYLSSGECARALRGMFLACKHSKGRHGEWIASFGILGSVVRCRKAWISPLLAVVSTDTRQTRQNRSDSGSRIHFIWQTAGWHCSRQQLHYRAV